MVCAFDADGDVVHRQRIPSFHQNLIFVLPHVRAAVTSIFMANKINNELRFLVENFTTELTALVERTVSEALENLPLTSSLKGRRAHQASATSPQKASRRGKKARAARSRAAGRRASFHRRTPEELADLESRLYREIKRKGGRRIEEIAESLGEDTKTLTLPAKKLIGANKVRTSGQKRATRYTAA